jgi:L-malate glycosyltransferase
MKILHAVENYFPSTGGMQEVVKQLSERLVAKGHEVTVATSVNQQRNFTELNGVRIEAFDVKGNWAGGMHGEVERYRQFLLNSDFDVITFFAAQQFTTDAALEILSQIKAKKVSVPTGYSGFYQDHYRKYYEHMRSWIKEFDMNVYLSDDYRDINFARENEVSRLMIIPNGADEREFEGQIRVDIRKKFSIPADHSILLHVGSYTGRKGHKEALEIFLRSDLKNCTLLMIGDNLDYFKTRSIYKYPSLLFKWQASKLSSKNIIMDSADRKTTVAAFRSADLFFFPSQIECSPIVLFEAAAAGIPFLASAAGNSSEIAEWTKGGQILPGDSDDVRLWHPDIKKSADVLNEMMSDKNKLKLMGERAHEIWKEKYTWKRISEEYEKLYQQLTLT